MHDHLRLGLAHHPCHGIGVESVGHHRVRSQAAEQVLLRCAPGHPDHLVASRHELGYERSAENACGAGYEDLHDCASRLILPSTPITCRCAASNSTVGPSELKLPCKRISGSPCSRARLR